MLFRQAKRFIIHQQEVAQQNQQATIEGQIKSAQVAEEEKSKTKQMEMEIEERRTKIKFTVRQPISSSKYGGKLS